MLSSPHPPPSSPVRLLREGGNVLSLLHPPSPFLYPAGGGRGCGEGEGRQAYSAAPTLKPSKPFAIASRSRMRCPLPIPRPGWRCHSRASATE